MQRKPLKWYVFCFCVMASVMTPALTHAQDLAEKPEKEDRDITVRVHKDGDRLVIDSSFAVEATREQVWSVLTDFEHLPSFVSNVESSKVLSQNDNVYRVAQKGRASRGFLAFRFESVQELRLRPFEEIDAHLVSGTMKQMDGVTHLVDEAGVTRVIYHGASIPDVWLPPVIGVRMVEAELREQYREVRREILKRKQAAVH